MDACLCSNTDVTTGIKSLVARSIELIGMLEPVQLKGLLRGKVINNAISRRNLGSEKILYFREASQCS